MRVLTLSLLLSLVCPTAARAEDDPPLVDPSLPTPVIRDESTPREFAPHRHAFLVGGLFLGAGVALGTAARSDELTARGDPYARSARLAWDGAKQSAAGANICYALAGAALVYGLAMELLPDDLASKAQLKLEF